MRQHKYVKMKVNMRLQTTQYHTITQRLYAAIAASHKKMQQNRTWRETLLLALIWRSNELIDVVLELVGCQRATTKVRDERSTEHRNGVITIFSIILYIHWTDLWVLYSVKICLPQWNIIHIDSLRVCFKHLSHTPKTDRIFCTQASNDKIVLVIVDQRQLQ